MQAALSPGLAFKVDGLLVKVCQLLHRCPKSGQRLRIFLVQDGRQVNNELHQVFLVSNIISIILLNLDYAAEKDGNQPNHLIRGG
jgi:hypothetical protein